MDSKSLMIGDWVTFKECQYENPMPIKIIAIGFQTDEEDDCLVQINGDKACDIITIDDEIVGIPLTAEILEKNFPNTDSGLGWFPDGDGFHCDTSYSEGDILASGFFRYVHELQHALRLCGIEKEIEI